MRRSAALAGAGCGFALWIVCSLLIRSAPPAFAFYLTAFVFVFGCGAIALIPLEDQMAAPERLALSCALGTALAPLLIYVFALCRAGFLFAPLTFVASGVAAARWWTAPSSTLSRRGGWTPFIVLPIAVFAVTLWVSSGRIRIASEGVSIFGDYETLDLTYYAGIASELAHTRIIPPLSPFFAGHRVIYSYFPLLLLSAVHNFTGVSLTASFLLYGWPFFTALACAAFLAFCRRLGSTAFAVVSTLLLFYGSTLAYLAAAFVPGWVKFDRLIWSSTFMAPSGEWAFFNTWSPALIVLSAGFYGLLRMHEPTGTLWAAVASVSFGLAFMFKSFSFEIVVPALLVAAVVCAWRRDPASRPLVGVAVGSALVAAPWLLSVLPYNQVENRGAHVTLAPWALVHRMLLKTDLIDPIAAFLRRLTTVDPGAWSILGVATVIFLVGGLGTRLLGLVPLWRAAIGREPMRRWTPFAWIVILGVAMGFLVDVAPFPNSLQTYLFALYLLWPFTVCTIWPNEARPSAARCAATAVLIALSVPATVHYAFVAHQAPRGEPLTRLDNADLGIVRYLRRTDADRTLMVHSNPLWPSLYAIESERRVVLAWSSYVEGDGNPDVDALSAEIAAFFGSPSHPGVDDVTLLRTHGVTHVIERVATDRINPQILARLRLVTGTPAVRLYEVPADLVR